MRIESIEAHAVLVPLTTPTVFSTRRRPARSLPARRIQPDACVAGGISEWRRIAARAAAHDILVAPHWHATLHAQLAAATPNCTTVEYFALSEGIYGFEELVSNPLTPKDGHITLNPGPGIGIETDWRAVSHHAIAGTAVQR